MFYGENILKKDALKFGKGGRGVLSLHPLR